MSVVALIVAAGRGSRAGEGVPKQYRSLNGQTVLKRTLDCFLAHPRVDYVIAVIHPDDEALYSKAIGSADSDPQLLPAAYGGKTRQDSVRNGLEALSDVKANLVLVHDAARPFVNAELIDRAIDAATAWGAAVPGIPVTDTIKVLGDQDMVAATPDRASLRAVQTPQAFRFTELLEAHRKAADTGLHAFTDDGALAEWAGLPVHVFTGEASNIKLTHPSDFAEAEQRLKGSRMTYVTRVGTGFDVH
ncbi:MAG: 2-C-methyl-D-erythritol 4-phosphate cytidylyltransferase, partial [Microvirga sp.]